MSVTEKARDWLASVNTTAVGDPHTGVSLDGSEVVLEWWSGERRLSVWFDEDDEDDMILRIWAPDINNGMSEHGVSAKDAADSFEWLMGVS